MLSPRPRNPTLVQDALDDDLREREEGEYKAPTCWRASGLGSCLTSRYLARQDTGEDGEPFDDRTLRVFAMGWMIEDFVLDKVEKNIPMKRQESFFSKKWNLSGHCDALTEDEVIELKSCHSRDFWNIGHKYPPKLQHRLQLWAYLKGFKRDVGRLVYISKDDMSIKEFLVQKDDKKLEFIVETEMKILNEAWEKQMPPVPMRFTEEGLLVPLEKTAWQYKYSAYSASIFDQKLYMGLDKYVAASKRFVASQASTTSKEANRTASLPI